MALLRTTRLLIFKEFSNPHQNSEFQYSEPVKHFVDFSKKLHTASLHNGGVRKSTPHDYLGPHDY